MTTWGSAFPALWNVALSEELMTMPIVFATLLLLVAILLFGGTIVIVLRRACAQPSRVNEIRRLRQAGLAVNQEGEAA